MQLEIEEMLRNERLAEEERRYFTQLMQRASVSDQRQMVERLVAFAINRYQPDLAPAAAPAPKPASREDEPPSDG